jgi:hypothetical protein
MLRFVLQAGYENIQDQIWAILKTHPVEFAFLWLGISIILLLMFKYVFKRMNYGFALLSFAVGFGFALLIVLGSYPASALLCICVAGLQVWKACAF